MTTAPGFMPDAINENIVPGSNDPQITPCGVIEHIAVSNSDDIRPIFTDGRGIESHFYVRFDGTIIQYRSIFFEADANFSGNSFGSPRKGFVSVEHEGGFPNGQGVLTKAQLASFKRIVLFVKSKADFPLRVCPAWDAPGVGYHSLFKEWNPNGHTCPGPERIKQFHEDIEPWLATALKPKPKPTPPPEDTFDASILSGRFDKGDKAVSAGWEAERKRGASLLLGTELAGRTDETIGGDPHYGVLHSDAGGSKSENAVEYAKADWDLEDSKLFKVWDGGGTGRFKNPAFARIAVIRNKHVDRELCVIQNHDPAHLFKGSKFFRPGNLARWLKVRNREAYVMRALRVEHPDAAFMLSGDPNASGTFLERYMATHFAGFKAANNYRFGAAWVSGLRRVGPVESVPTPSSDHPIQRVRLAWAKPKKKR